MMLKDFEGVVSPALGALCVDLTIGSKTLPTTFFVINGKVSADSSFSVASAEAHIVSYDQMNCLSGQAWEKDLFRMADYEVTSVKSGDSSDES